jgi:hypothetical protein
MWVIDLSNLSVQNGKIKVQFRKKEIQRNISEITLKCLINLVVKFFTN